MAVVIQIENLVKRYKELVALDHLWLAWPKRFRKIDND